MSTAAHIGKKVVWLADSIVNFCVLIVILLLLVFGCYAVWDSGLVANGALATRYEAYKPSAANGGKTFQELQDINPDVFSWLTVYGTHIDYPVVQSEDNQRYINTNAEGHHALTGAIFLDYRNNHNFSDFNNIIYGHHMEKQAMFGEIGRFADEEYFDTHRYGMLYYGGIEHGVEFFAFFHCDGYDTNVYNPGVTGLENQQAYLDMIRGMSTYVRDDVPVTTDNRIVMLSTCSSISTNGRDILVGVISDEVVDDPFISEITVGSTTHPVIRGVTDLWSQAPAWEKGLIIVVLPLLLVLLLALLMNKRKQKRAYAEVPHNRGAQAHSEMKTELSIEHGTDVSHERGTEAADAHGIEPADAHGIEPQNDQGTELHNVQSKEDK